MKYKTKAGCDLNKTASYTGMPGMASPINISVNNRDKIPSRVFEHQIVALTLPSSLLHKLSSFPCPS